MAVTGAAQEAPYTWTFPGAPVRILIATHLVQCMQDAISAMLSAEISVGRELWGLLLGRALSRGVIEIVEVKSVGYHPATAAAIEASGPDWQRAFNQWRSSNSGLTVVGYYRTACDGRVQLHEDELPLIQSHFLEPHNVFLVIGAAGGHGPSPNAGFFFWDRGQVHSSFSFLRFPFNARELRLRTAQQQPVAPQLKDPLAAANLPSAGATLEATPYSDRKGARGEGILTMYRQTFGLRKDPFNLTPDPGFLYLTAQHREALVGLTYAILQRKGFVVMTGEAGTGKTTLLARALQFLPVTKLQFSVVLNPTLTPAEFLEMVLLDFGLRDIPASKAQRLWRLQNLILQGARDGKVSALVVDEAHKLSPEVLEEIRLLGNFEDADHKLLQILLVGQTELNDILDRDDLRQLKQRIAVRLSIGPLAATDIEQYIRHRWLRAGGTRAPFSEAAVDEIAYMSRGIPRLINSLCENALTLALGEGSVMVDRQHVEAAATDLHLKGLLPRSFPDAEQSEITPTELVREPGVEANGVVGHTRVSRLSRWAGRLRHKTT